MTAKVALYFGILELGQRLGHFTLDAPAFDIAQNLVALEDSYGMHIVSGNRSLPAERCTQLLLSYAQNATRCDTLILSRDHR